MGFKHIAIKWCGHFGKGLSQLGLACAGSCACAASFSRLELGLRHVQCSLAHKALGLQLLRTLEVGLSIGKLGIGLRQLRTRALNQGLRVAVVNGRQHLACAYTLSHFDHQLHDPSAGLSRNRAVLDRLDNAINFIARRHSLNGHLLDRHLRTSPHRSSTQGKSGQYGRQVQGFHFHCTHGISPWAGFYLIPQGVCKSAQKNPSSA